MKEPIVNKQNQELKGYFIQVSCTDHIQKVIDDIEYEKFLKRNSELIKSEQLGDDETLLDGLTDEY